MSEAEPRAARARLALPILAIALVCACSSDPPQRLVLLVTADTLRADRLGAYGGPAGGTPHLDRLAAESTLFESAFAPTSYTLPSVGSLLTGRYPEEIGTLANRHRLPDDVATLAEILSFHGFRTGAVVSNFVLRRGVGFERGFDHYDDTLPEKEAYRDVPERTGPRTTEAALAMLDRLGPDEADVFLWVHYQDPHGPYLPPDGLRERHLEVERARPDGLRELEADAASRGLGAIPAYQFVAGQREVAFYRAGYAGEIEYLDRQVGLLLEELSRRGLDERAVVVFSADHGEAMGEGDYWFAHGEYLLEGLVRVPLLVRAPGRAPGRREEVASLVDVLPTILHLAGVGAPLGHKGRALLDEAAPREPRGVYLATLGGSPRPRYGWVEDGHKYVVSWERGGAQESLVRLGRGEEELADRDPERLAALRGRLRAFRSRLSGRDVREQVLDARSRAMLESLGYVEEFGDEGE